VFAMGKVESLHCGRSRSCHKDRVQSAAFRAGHGLVGDAHAGGGHRQVSLLPGESLQRWRQMGADPPSGAPGANIITAGLDLGDVVVGAHMAVGDGVLLEVTQVGHVCPRRCDVYYSARSCPMPVEAVYCRVLKGGRVTEGDEVVLLAAPEAAAGCTGRRRRRHM